MAALFESMASHGIEHFCPVLHQGIPIPFVATNFHCHVKQIEKKKHVRVGTYISTSHTVLVRCNNASPFNV